MVRLTRWQWVVIAAPIAAIVGFLLIAAGWQIHTWHLNWIWGVVVLVFVGWRWLLVKWTQPTLNQIEAAIEGVSSELELIAEGERIDFHVSATVFGRVFLNCKDLITQNCKDLGVAEFRNDFGSRIMTVRAVRVRVASLRETAPPQFIPLISNART
jgi:hypothetical protein